MTRQERDGNLLDVWVVCGALLAWLAMVGVLWLLHGDEARAQTVETTAAPIEIRFDVGTIEGPPGSVHPIGSEEVPIGFVCDVTVEIENNESEHHGTDALVEELTIADVEDVPMSSGIVGTGTVVSDGLIEAAIRVGEDGVVSAGISVVLDCGPPPPASTTTTSLPETTTTVPGTPTSTTSTTSTTLSPPPVGPVPAGGGAMADLVALVHPHPPLRPWYSVGADVWIVVGLGLLAASAIVLVSVRRRR